MTDALRIALVLVASYCIGGIPWGLVLVRAIKHVDIRDFGSGKTGATNVLRLLGWQGFVVALVLDALKGIGAVLLARYVTGNSWVEAAAGLLAISGHCWSPYLGFRGGGRGMVTAMGAAFTMAPGLILLVPVFLIPVLLTRYMSLGNVTVSLSAPVVLLIGALLGWSPWAYFIFGLAGCALILINHSDNIQRLLAGTERKIGDKVTPRSPEPGAQAH
jgi:acyl phosphate:glycerol-3-phosphate acyltransferase